MNIFKYKYLAIIFIFNISILLVNSELKAQKTIKYFITMWTSNTITLWDGTTVPIYSFHDGFKTPKHPIPGPTIYANEGDSVIIIARNISRPHDHTIHLHGLDLDTRNDGDPATSFAIPHGTDCTYAFRATHAGTYIYHCHYMDVTHVQMGMYGTVIIRAANGVKTAWTNGPKYDKEYSWLNSELDQLWHDSIPKRPSHTITIPLPPYRPNYFLINGRSKQQLKDTTVEIQATSNEVVYLRLGNIGYYYNKIIFPSNLKVEIIDSDGRPLPKSSFINSLEISPGERYGVLISSDKEMSDSIIVEFKNMNTFQTKGIEKVAVQFNKPNAIETSIEEVCNIFPNPTQHVLNVNFKQEQEMKTIKIFNLFGQTVFEKSFTPKETSIQIDCKSFEAGVYWLKYNDRQFIKTQKISIIK